MSGVAIYRSSYEALQTRRNADYVSDWKDKAKQLQRTRNAEQRRRPLDEIAAGMFQFYLILSNTFPFRTIDDRLIWTDWYIRRSLCVESKGRIKAAPFDIGDELAVQSNEERIQVRIRPDQIMWFSGLCRFAYRTGCARSSLLQSNLLLQWFGNFSVRITPSMAIIYGYACAQGRLLPHVVEKPRPMSPNSLVQRDREQCVHMLFLSFFLSPSLILSQLLINLYIRVYATSVSVLYH